MKPIWKLIIIITVVIVLTAAYVRKRSRIDDELTSKPASDFQAFSSQEASLDTGDKETKDISDKETKAEAQKLPRVIDIGRDTCIPCKMMAPVLAELAEEYKGRAIIKVINLDEDPSAATKYGIYLIPTQIFFDKGGNEVYRHEGYMPKGDIVAKLKEMGVD